MSTPSLDVKSKIWITILGFGFATLIAGSLGAAKSNPTLWMWLSFGPLIIGGTGYAVHSQLKIKPGIHNHGVFFSSISNRGFWGYLMGVGLTSFYAIFYIY